MLIVISLALFLQDPIVLFYMHNTVLGPGAMLLNKYLESHGFCSPTDYHGATFHYAHKTGLDL
jgi:hypothetical protein